MNRQDFLARHCADLPTGLAAAVIKQSGGWQSFKENAPDIARHGIDGGFRGWIWHSDTVSFFRKNRAAIVDWLASLAVEFGTEPVTMLQGWRCLQDCSTAEILQTLAGTVVNDTVANGLSWGIVEEVANRFANACED